MKRVFFFFVAFMATGSPIFAAVQTIIGGGTVAINANGIADGVSFLDANPTTLTVGNGQNINNNNNAAGVSASSPGVDSILFQGNTNTSIVNGTVGAINTLLDISGGLGSSTILFNGVVTTATFHVTGNGTMQFNSTANGALTFNTDGNLIIGPGVIFNGAVNNLAANSGTLTLNSASTLNGTVGAAVGALKQVNVVGGNSTINGSLSATNFSLGQNTLHLVGALALPVNTVINTTLISDTLFGNISAPGQNDNISAPVVTVNVDATQAVLTGAPLFVVRAGAGTSNVPIIVNSNSIRYSFIGLNTLGNIELLPSLIPASALTTNPVAAAVGSVLDALIPFASPGSDLAFIEAQLAGLPTSAAFTDALLQIAPASGLIGVNRESFNTTRQFQKVWLEHLQRNRQRCRCQCMDACDNPCGCWPECPMVWGDGFGFIGHQDDKDDLNGYHVNTWGAVLGLDIPVRLCGLRVGLAAGYAFTDLDERDFGNNTDIHNYQGTAYFSYDPSCWYVDGGVSIGWNRYDGTRHIAFAGVNRTARAEYDGLEYSTFVATGYQYCWNCWEITPLGSLLYSHLHMDDYTEKGAESLNLHVDKQNYDFVESGLGLKLATQYQTQCGLYIPEVHSIWFHDFNDNRLNVNATFVEEPLGGSFSNRGPKMDRDTWNIGGSVTCMANRNMSVQAVYDYEKSRTYWDHQVLLELSYDF